jgi:hypothetical protein
MDAVDDDIYFEVSKEAMLNSCEYFSSLIATNERTGNASIIVFSNETPVSFEVVLRYFHNTLTSESSDVTVADIYHVIHLCQKHNIDAKKLGAWFDSCWRRLTLERHGERAFSMLMFPTFAFNHADAFSYVSKGLTMEGTHQIHEDNPTNISHLHCPREIISELLVRAERLQC